MYRTQITALEEILEKLELGHLPAIGSHDCYYATLIG